MKRTDIMTAAPTNTVSASATIPNKKGLHARASAKLVKLVEQLDVTVELRNHDITADGSSILDLMMLSATQGTMIEIYVSGQQAPDVLQTSLEQILALIQDGFGEED